MSRIFFILNKMFTIFFTGNNNILFRVILHIKQSPYLLFGVVFLIIGFSVSIISRIIHNT